MFGFFPPFLNGNPLKNIHIIDWFQSALLCSEKNCGSPCLDSPPDNNMDDNVHESSETDAGEILKKLKAMQSL